MLSKQLWSANTLHIKIFLSFYNSGTFIFDISQSVLPAAYVYSLFNFEYTPCGVMQSLKVMMMKSFKKYRSALEPSYQ